MKNVLEAVAKRLGGELDLVVKLETGALEAVIEAVKGPVRLVSYADFWCHPSEAFVALRATSSFSRGSTYIVLHDAQSTTMVYGVSQPWPKLVRLALSRFSGMVIVRPAEGNPEALRGTLLIPGPPSDKELSNSEMMGSPDANPVSRYLRSIGKFGVDNEEGCRLYERYVEKSGYKPTAKKTSRFMDAAIRACPRYLQRELF